MGACKLAHKRTSATMYSSGRDWHGDTAHLLCCIRSYITLNHYCTSPYITALHCSPRLVHHCKIVIFIQDLHKKVNINNSRMILSAPTGSL